MGGFRAEKKKKADCSERLSVRGGKNLSSVDIKLQRSSMSSEVKGNALDWPWVSYDSQIQKCRVKFGDLMGG